MTARKSVLKLLVALATAGVLVFSLASPANASAATVGFRAGSWHCPNGVYGVSHVDVFGTGGAPNITGTWGGPSNTQTAYVPISGVPANGGQAYVVLTYHCKVRTIFGTLPGPGEPANGYRWIYGSGTQPTYTL